MTIREQRGTHLNYDYCRSLTIIRDGESTPEANHDPREHFVGHPVDNYTQNINRLAVCN